MITRPGSLLTLLVVLGCDVELRFEEPSDAGARRDAGLPDTGPADSGPLDSGAEERLTCLLDQDCGDHGLFCAPEISECLECLESSQCTREGRSRCHINHHRCVECVAPRDCPPSQVCERVSNICVPLCRDDGECPEGRPRCDLMRHFCVECAGDLDCRGAPDGSRCDRAAGRCVPCLEDSHCPTEQPHCDRVSGRCVGCVTSADCARPRPVCDPLGLTCQPL